MARSWAPCETFVPVASRFPSCSSARLLPEDMSTHAMCEPACHAPGSLLALARVPEEHSSTPCRGSFYAGAVESVGWARWYIALAWPTFEFSVGMEMLAHPPAFLLIAVCLCTGEHRGRSSGAPPLLRLAAIAHPDASWVLMTSVKPILRERPPICSRGSATYTLQRSWQSRIPPNPFGLRATIASQRHL